MSRINFRKVLLLQAALVIILLCVIFSDFAFGVPESIRQAEMLYEINKVSSTSFGYWIEFGAIIILLATYVTGFFGLYFFRRWSIWLNVILIVIDPIVSYLIQYEINDWVSMTLNNWLAVSTGFVLAVACLTSTKNEFK